jgi:hypothetical protein
MKAQSSQVRKKKKAKGVKAKFDSRDAVFSCFEFDFQPREKRWAIWTRPDSRVAAIWCGRETANDAASCQPPRRFAVPRKDERFFNVAAPPLLAQWCRSESPVGLQVMMLAKQAFVLFVSGETEFPSSWQTSSQLSIGTGIPVMISGACGCCIRRPRSGGGAEGGMTSYNASLDDPEFSPTALLMLE